MGGGAYRDADDRFWDWAGLERSERMVRLASTGTEVRVQFYGEGPDVLFLHGAPNAGSTWVPMLRYLEGFRCILVDRPGCGLSEPLSLEFSEIRPFAETFAVEVLDALELEHSHLVASSLGGHLALLAAGRAPDRFERMVQMACPALVPGMKLPAIMRGLSIGPVRRVVNALPPNRTAGKQMMRQIGHGKSIAAGKIPEPFFEWYLALQRDTDTMKNDGELIGAAISPIAGVAPELELTTADLKAVSTPTLYLWGEDDTYGGEDVARNLVATQPNAELEMLPDSGHLPWVDEPEHIARRTREFLASG